MGPKWGPKWGQKGAQNRGPRAQIVENRHQTGPSQGPASLGQGPAQYRPSTGPGWALGLYWACTGPVLGLYWACTGLGPARALAGPWLGPGPVLGLYWACTGPVLGLYWAGPSQAGWAQPVRAHSMDTKTKWGPEPAWAHDSPGPFEAI